MKTSSRTKTKRSLKQPPKQSQSPKAVSLKNNSAVDVIPREVIKKLQQDPQRAILYQYSKTGIVPYTAEETYTNIKKSSHALKVLGVKPNQHVGIMAKPSPNWIWFDQAILSLGAISTGFFVKSSFESLESQLTETQTKVIFLDSEESCEKLTAFQKDLKTVIIGDSLYPKIKKNKNFTSSRVLSWSDFLKLGEIPEPKSTRSFEKNLLALQAEQRSATVYTTGTSGLPKGVMFSHQDLIFQMETLKKRYPTDPTEDRSVTILPLSHILERITVYYYIASGVPVCFLEEKEDLIDAMAYFKPTGLTVVPKILELIHQGVHQAAPRTFPFRQLFKMALKSAENREPDSPPSLKNKLLQKLIYNKIYNRLGGKIKFVVCSAAALNHKLLRFFHAINIPVYEGYGSTETCTVVSCSNETYFKPYSAGKIAPKVQTKISSRGELLIHSPSLMSGYLKKSKLTQSVLKKDASGKYWFATGDKVRIEDNYLFLEGRISDFFKTSSGNFINPLLIEKLIAEHHLVGNVVVVGENRPMVCALIFIDPIHLHRNRSEFQNIIEKQFQDWIDSVNAKLDPWEVVKKFKVIWKALSYKEDELTLKFEPRRDKIQEKFKAEIESFYTLP